MKTRRLSGTITPQAAAWGWFWWLFQLCILGSLLQWGNRALGGFLSQAELNFIYFLINFIAALVIFGKFWVGSWRCVCQHPIIFLESVILGLAGYYAGLWIVNGLIRLFLPGFQNFNDNSLLSLAGASRFLMGLGLVVLTPVAEEGFYRGLFFGSFYPRHRVGAYALSIGVFALIHVLPYLGAVSALRMGAAILQYLPAGFFLAWSYTKSGTVFAPVLMHMIINAIAIGFLR